MGPISFLGPRLSLLLPLHLSNHLVMDVISTFSQLTLSALFSSYPLVLASQSCSKCALVLSLALCPGLDHLYQAVNDYWDKETLFSQLVSVPSSPSPTFRSNHGHWISFARGRICFISHSVKSCYPLWASCPFLQGNQDQIFIPVEADRPVVHSVHAVFPIVVFRGISVLSRAGGCLDDLGLDS